MQNRNPSPASSLASPAVSDPTLSVTWRCGLPALVAELDRQRASRVDFVASAADLRVIPLAIPNLPAPVPALAPAPGNAQVGEWLTAPTPISRRAYDQLATRLSPSVPTRFARDLFTTSPAIASNLLNDLSSLGGGRRLIRCLDNKVRAVLSDKYRIFDDYDIALTTLDAIRASEGTVLDCVASDSRFDIRFTATHMIEHIPETRGGDGNAEHISRTTLDPNQFKHLGLGAVCPFVRVSHSSVGEGGLSVSYGILRLFCLNGAITDRVLNQIHIGAATNVGLLSEETVAADSKAIMLKCRDLIQASLKPETFRSVVSSAKAAASDYVVAPSSAVQNIVSSSHLTDTDREGILQYFLRDYDQNRWGLAQAVSRYAQDVDADKAVELESVSGSLIKSGSLLTVVS